MERFVEITLNASAFAPSFAAPLAAHFGPGAPGWLARDVPGETEFDFVNGVAIGPAGKLVRMRGTTKWARAH